ncbi:MAG: nodulation protein NfeD [Bacteroidota bacterium]
MKGILIHIILLFFLPAIIWGQKIIALTIDGSINPASAGYIHDAIKKANDENAGCLLIHLNTPGGLLKSTRNIVADIMESEVPVVVYVSPGGAHAGSAGVFITMAAHIAAMAPGTNIGAAHPVSGNGGIVDSTMNTKVTNDAVAFIRSIAEERKRNGEWGEAAVRNSKSIPEFDALQNNVIDLVAINEKDLLNKIDGRLVKTNTATITMQTKGVAIERMQMRFIEKLLNLLSDPNVAYILLMIGFYGILFELYNPSVLIPGIVGGIALILALYAMQSLPINYAGVALIIFAVILFLLEIKVTSYGMLTIGGVVALLLGSMMLVKKVPGLEFLRISWSVILSTTAVTTLFFLFVLGFGLKAQRLKPVTGIQGLLGSIGECILPISPTGTISIEGEIWNAISSSGNITAGEKVRVVAVDGLTLVVETA